MMLGSVNGLLEARLNVSVYGDEGKARDFETVIDTGFTGFLTLPITLIEQLKLSWLYRHHGELADGTIAILDVYEAAITWDDETLTIEVECMNATPLLGMSLMAGHELRIEVVEGGNAALRSL